MMGINTYLNRPQKQRLCNHEALIIRVSEESYFKHYRRRYKVEIVCADCLIAIARAGEVWINDKKAIRAIIAEHYPRLLPDLNRR